MAYDDDGSRFGFDDRINWAALFELYQSQPGNLSLRRLTAAIVSLNQLAVHQDLNAIPAVEVNRILEQQGMGQLPASAVNQMLKAIQPYAGDPDILSRLSVKDIEGILKR